MGVMSGERVIGRIPLGEHTEIRVVLSVTDEGWQRLDLRQWWKPAGENLWQPTKKGLNIPAQRKADLIRALQGEKPQKSQ